jgi:hypothetical protein
MGLGIKLSRILKSCLSFPDLLTEGFSYHEKTPPISRTMINPVSGLSLADAMLILFSSQLADESDTTGSADTSNQHCPPPPVSLFSLVLLNLSPLSIIFNLINRGNTSNYLIR